ncbi:MAG: hypothetical protein K0U98_11420 [Deltaproteobacteria bacterium]|nr:hypothetical protein [Deltaproteobacteria bacterium]
MRETIYVAIRQDSTNGDEWLDLATASFNLEGVLTQSSEVRGGSWVARNGLVAVAKCELVQVARKSWQEARAAAEKQPTGRKRGAA